MAKKLSNDYRQLLAILRTALFGEPLVLDDTADFAAIYKELRLQAILPLTSKIFTELPLSEEIAGPWKQDLLRYFYEGVRIRQEERQLTELLKAAAIPAAVLKGSAAALYYPDDLFRNYGDVDVLVSPDTYESAAALMSENGYQATCGLYDDPRNITFRHNGIPLELHHRFVKADNSPVDAILQEALKNTQERIYDGMTVTALPDLENGLVLLEHLHIHLQGELGFRQIVDWLMYVAAVCDDTYWEQNFRPLTDKVGLTRLAIAVTALGKRYLGLPARITWCDEADRDTVDRLLDFIFANGNFGNKKRNNKNENDRVIVNIVGQHRSIGGWFRYLQSAGMSHWKLAQKCVLFRPFAWLYQLFRYLVRGLQGKAFLTYFRSEQRAEAKEKRALYRDLDI